MSFLLSLYLCVLVVEAPVVRPKSKSPAALLITGSSSDLQTHMSPGDLSSTAASSSAWSLENHPGSREDSPRTVYDGETIPP